MTEIYLDNAATTPLDPRVVEAMEPFLTGGVFGNPSSVHGYGRAALAALDRARGTVADAIGARESEIIFTSGGTEADFLALAGIMPATGKRQLVTSAIEHHAVLHVGHWLRELSYEVTTVSPGSDGRLDTARVLEQVTEHTGLVSIMWVNNETGARQPIETLAVGLYERGVPFHSDAVQAISSEPIDVKACPVSSLSFSGHKLFGPKGVGALYLRTGTPFRSPLRGGSQERGRRPGTENLAGIAGFARAVELLVQEREFREAHVRRLRAHFVRELVVAIPNAIIHESLGSSPHIVNVAILGISAGTLLMNLDLDGVAASGGSACTAGNVEPSHVLLAQGMAPDLAESSLRFSFSSKNSEDEIHAAVGRLAAIVERLRGRTAHLDSL